MKGLEGFASHGWPRGAMEGFTQVSAGSGSVGWTKSLMSGVGGGSGGGPERLVRSLRQCTRGNLVYLPL